MCTLKFSSEQIWTLGWAFMQRNTNVQASQGLHRATEPWTVKMSGPINNNAGSSMLDLNVCTSFCIFRWSTWEVYLCHTVSEFFFFHDRSLQSEAVAMGLISLSQSTSVRFKATKPQGSQAAAACSVCTAGSCSKSDGIGQVNVHEGVILVEEKHKIFHLNFTFKFWCIVSLKLLKRQRSPRVCPWVAICGCFHSLIYCFQ